MIAATRLDYDTKNCCCCYYYIQLITISDSATTIYQPLLTTSIQRASVQGIPFKGPYLNSTERSRLVQGRFSTAASVAAGLFAAAGLFLGAMLLLWA